VLEDGRLLLVPVEEVVMHVVVHVKDLFGRREPACAWDDHESRTQLEAADRAWRICNGFFGNLAGWELEARGSFDAAARGLSIGPGDFVEVDGVRWVCRRVGFERG
jgi:hypothetical protein